MKRLPRVHSGLKRLRLFRSTVRLGVCGSTVLSILLWTLAVAFLLDWRIRMDSMARTIVLVAVIGVAIWTIWRYLLPALRVHESDTALAVMVDGKHAMHSDLVAAIQFDDSTRPQYGSEQLREAVVKRTGQAATRLSFLEGFSRMALMNRLLMLVITAAACLVPAGLYRAHAGAFLNRLLLGDAHYPRRTIIDRIASPGSFCIEGSPVTFEIHTRGESVESGHVQIKALSSGLPTKVELSGKNGIYTGTLKRVVDDLSYTVHLGDDYTDPQRLTVIRLPRATLDLRDAPPSYVRRKKAPPRSVKRRHAVVLEGSRVIPVVTADKDIISATLTFENDDRPYELNRPGKSFEWDNPTWPLARVTGTVRFKIHLTDRDGLSPAEPIRGLVQVTTDRRPRVGLQANSRFVVPEAAPALIFAARDDHALDSITLHVTIIDTNGQPTKMQFKTSPPPNVTITAADGEQGKAPLAAKRVIELKKDRADRATYRAWCRLPLSGLKLEKGSQVVVAAEAVDYRGTFNDEKVKGKSGWSQKWVFEVSDEAGVKEAMRPLTTLLSKKLSELIDVQYEAGE